MKRKYTKIGEKVTEYECTKRNCKWQGKDEERATRELNESISELVCPNCGNNEFYGLLKATNPELLTPKIKEDETRNYNEKN